MAVITRVRFTAKAFFLSCCASLRHSESRSGVLFSAISSGATRNSGLRGVSVIRRDFHFDDSDYDSLTKEEEADLLFLHLGFTT